MPNTNTRILLIDDEIDCLDQLKSALASKQDKWTIELSNNPQQALESILSNPPTIVLCDYRMPQINGAELLREAESVHPFIHRFIIAEREELEILEDGIGSAFHFLPKPCPAERLVSEIQRCLSVENWLGKTQIKNIVGTLGELPSLPSLYLKIIEALNESDVSIEKVGKAISTDITISAKILKIVNSSYFGFDETISDITQAVSVLGLETVKNLVLAIQVFSESESGEQKSQTDKLWQHSMNVATTAKNVMMYETGNARLAEGAYTSGLFHDIGKLVMQRAAPDTYRSAREFAKMKNVSSWEAENEVLGCNHAEAGAYLLARWGLPIEVIESAALHHEPVNSSGSSFSSLAAVYAANRLVSETGIDPDFKYDCPFISGLGKEAQWPTWRKIAAGNEIDEVSSDTGSWNSNSEEISQPQTRWNSETEDAVKSAAAKTEQETAKPKSHKKLVVSGLCGIACVAFACVLVIKNTGPDTTEDWEQGSFTTQADSGKGENGFETTTAQALNDEAPQLKADSITAEALITESFGSSAEPVKFPKINITKIYYDLPIPVANVNSKLVRIGDKVSGAQVVDIERENIIVQYEGMRKSYSSK